VGALLCDDGGCCGLPVPPVYVCLGVLGGGLP
jgi:hypothetical protein